LGNLKIYSTSLRAPVTPFGRALRSGKWADASLCADVLINDVLMGLARQRSPDGIFKLPHYHNRIFPFFIK